MEKEKEKEKEKEEKEKEKKKRKGKDIPQFYIYKLPIDCPAAVTGHNTARFFKSFPFPLRILI